MDNLTETERIRRDRLAVLVADALSKRAGNTVTGPLTLTASRVVDELLKDPWVLLDALDAVSRDHQRAEYKVRMSYLARAERAETELDEEREHRGRKEAQLLGAAMENKNLRADNEQLRKAIDAVLVRCRTGSQHSNWLPIIDSILSEALSGGPVGPSQSWHEQPPPAMDDDTKAQLRDRAERDEAAWESQNPPPPHGADAEPSRCTTCGQPQDYPGCLCMMEPYVDENDVPDQTVYEWWDKADPVQVEGGVCLKCGSGVLNSGEHIRTDLPPCYEDEDCDCDTTQHGGLHSRYCESKAPSHNRWCSPCGHIVSECRCESRQPNEDYGRSRAIAAATDAIAEAAEGFAASPEVFAEIAIDVALAKGSIVDVMEHKKALEAEAARADEWKAHVRKLEGALRFYAEPSTYVEGVPSEGTLTGPIPIRHDLGGKARDALEGDQ